MMAPYLWCAYVSSKFILPPFPWRLLQLKKKKKEESPMRTILECIQQFRAGREHTSVLAKASPPKKEEEDEEEKLLVCLLVHVYDYHPSQ